jgi:transcriptional regulator with XRE-family HTH domain
MFAERLKEMRAEKGITQIQLSEILGVSKGTVAMWETGKREPNFETVNALSEVFDKRIDYILGYSNDSSSTVVTEEEIEQLGIWAVEEDLTETMLSYLRLDAYGKEAVESVIRAEMKRCKEQETLGSKEDYKIAVRINVKKE